MTKKKHQPNRREFVISAIAGSVGAMLPRPEASAQTPHSAPSKLRLADSSDSPPSAPRELKAETVSASSVRLIWRAPLAGLASSYRIERSENEGKSWSLIAWEVVDTSYTDTGLLGASTYLYRLCAAGVGGTGPYSDAVGCMTFAASAIILDSFSQSTIRLNQDGITPKWKGGFGGTASVVDGFLRCQGEPQASGTSTGGNTSTTLHDTNAQFPSTNWGPSGQAIIAIVAGTGAG